jgi:Tfp pilus assembly protein PilV
MKKQSGFAAIEIVLLLVVVAVLGFTAYSYLSRQATNTSPESATATVPAAPRVSSTADLTAAENTVDQMDVDASSADSAQLDSELAQF